MLTDLDETATMNIPEIPDLPPVNDVPPVNNVPPVSRADLPAFSKMDPYTAQLAMRAQVSQLKRVNGKFSRGDMEYRPNELARLFIPAEVRAALPKVYTAPFLQDGAIVRVTGLWSRKKEPFRCWPVSCPASAYPYMIKQGHQRGIFIKPEWLERLPPGEQDKVFNGTCAKLGIDLTPPEAQGGSLESDPYAGLAPAVAARMRRLAERAAASANPGGSTVDMDALDVLEAIQRAHGDVNRMSEDMRYLMHDYHTALATVIRESDLTTWEKVEGGWTHWAVPGLVYSDEMAGTKTDPTKFLRNNAVGWIERQRPELFYTMAWALKHPAEASMMFTDLGHF